MRGLDDAVYDGSVRESKITLRVTYCRDSSQVNRLEDEKPTLLGFILLGSRLFFVVNST